MNIVQAGLWQLYQASKDIWKLKQSLLVSFFIHSFLKNSTVYFLLGDAAVFTLQNEVLAFNSLVLTYLFMLTLAAQAIGVYVY